MKKLADGEDEGADGGNEEADSFIHLGYFYSALQVQHYSEALPTQHECCVGVSRRSATDNCERKTCPRSLRGG